VTAQLDVQITPDLRSITARIKAQADGGKLIKRELAASLRKIGDRVVQAEQQAILGTTIRGVKGGQRTGDERIKRGGRRGQGQGVRRNIAAAIMRRNRLSGREQGVEVRVSKGRMPAGMGKIPFNANTQGQWRHPVFGDRNTWASQTVSPRMWWTRTAKEQTSKVNADMRAVLDEIARKLDAAIGG